MKTSKEFAINLHFTHFSGQPETMYDTLINSANEDDVEYFMDLYDAKVWYPFKQLTLAQLKASVIKNAEQHNEIRQSIHSEANHEQV
jgi:hypothetical protein